MILLKWANKYFSKKTIYTDNRQIKRLRITSSQKICSIQILQSYSNMKSTMYQMTDIDEAEVIVLSGKCQAQKDKNWIISDVESKTQLTGASL